jgi:hypothetical protein
MRGNWAVAFGTAVIEIMIEPTIDQDLKPIKTLLNINLFLDS